MTPIDIDIWANIHGEVICFLGTISLHEEGEKGRKNRLRELKKLKKLAAKYYEKKFIVGLFEFTSADRTEFVRQWISGRHPMSGVKDRDLRVIFLPVSGIMGPINKLLDELNAIHNKNRGEDVKKASQWCLPKTATEGKLEILPPWTNLFEIEEEKVDFSDLNFSGAGWSGHEYA